MTSAVGRHTHESDHAPVTLLCLQHTNSVNVEQLLVMQGHVEVMHCSNLALLIHHGTLINILLALCNAYRHPAP